MTLDEFCGFFKDKQAHYPESDSFVRDGYGQKAGGYINTAKYREIKIDSESAEPNQKWHLLDSYYKRTDGHKAAKRCYSYLLCPELLLWIGESAGFDIKEVANEARQIIDNGEKWSRNKAGRKIREKITWDMLEKKITEQILI